jgi:uridine kinase
MKVLEDNKKYTDNGELESHTITIELNSSNLSDAIYVIVCANEFYCDKENKPIDFVNKTKAETRLEFAIGLLQKELNKIR